MNKEDFSQIIFAIIGFFIGGFFNHPNDDRLDQGHYRQHLNGLKF